MDFPVRMMYIKNPYHGFIVEFTDYNVGKVVDLSECKHRSLYMIGYKSNDWVNCANTDSWQPVEVPIIVPKVFLDDTLFEVM